MKYDSPINQSEILPNLLGLQSVKEIGISEFEGFLKAEIQLTESLTAKTKFNVSYILKIFKITFYKYKFNHHIHALKVQYAALSTSDTN